MLYYKVKASADGAERGRFANRINLVKDEILTAEECEKHRVLPTDVEPVEVKKHWVYRLFGVRFFDENMARRWYNPDIWHIVAGQRVCISYEQKVNYGRELETDERMHTPRTKVFRKTRAGWVDVSNQLSVDAFYHGIKRGTVKLAESAADAALV